MADVYPQITVAGGPRERGLQHGEQARDRVRLSVRAYEEVFAHLTGWDWNAVKANARRFVPAITAYDARYLAEMEGIAAGAGLEPDDVLALNVRTEVMFAARAAGALRLQALPVECTSFALLPQATSNGHTLIGQNWDWLSHAVETTIVLIAHQEDERPSFATVVEAGLLAKTGFNSAGIGLAVNALVTDADRGAAAVPFHIILRGVIESPTISDALDAVQRLPRSSSGNILVAHADGVAVDLETEPGDYRNVFRVFPDADGVIVHANHYETGSRSHDDLLVWLAPCSPFRADRLRRLIRQAHRELSSEALSRMLADHVGYPLSVCYHQDPRLHPRLEGGVTVASVVMDLDERRLLLAEGQPCSAAFREVALAGF